MFFQVLIPNKCVFFLTTSQNGSIMELNDYVHATWLTSPNQDFASSSTENNSSSAKDVVRFGGLQITSSGVTPSDHLLNVISSFLTPQNITESALTET